MKYKVQLHRHKEVAQNGSRVIQDTVHYVVFFYIFIPTSTVCGADVDRLVEARYTLDKSPVNLGAKTFTLTLMQMGKLE